jgi:DNA invertase Pin-like site-specific DNA recombinase
MLVGYARVSTTDQTDALQIDALKAAGGERIHRKTASGAKQDHPTLAEALAFASGFLRVQDPDVLSSRTP